MNPPKLTDALTDANQGAAASDTRFFGHPRGLATLFFTEMWERFSYYGMRAFLLYYMTASAAAGGLGFTDAQGASAYGTYTGSAWGASIVGGLIADRFLGQYRSVLWGGVLIMLGHLSLVFPPVPFFYAGLALVVAGTGLLKPSVSTLVGSLYEQGDRRRDDGFSIFYNYANQGFIFVTLKDWTDRKAPEQSVYAIIERFNRAFFAIPEARVFALNEPPISGRPAPRPVPSSPPRAKAWSAWTTW